MNVIICGIGGKVGKTLLSILEKKEDMKVVCGIDLFANPNEFSIPVYSDFSKCNEKADVIIDFSRPNAIDGILNYAIKNSCNLVVATTGHNANEEALINKAAESIAIFKSSNMSLGVNLLINLAKQAAKFLGNSFDIEIVEYHHNLKVDSPSGTALSIAEGINGVFDNKKNYVYGRHSGNDKRNTSDIGIHAVRGGTIVGKHDVMYIGNNEIVTLKHEAESRGVFAYGALRAAEFISDKKRGLYNMNDIIGKDYPVTVVSSDENVALFTLEKISLACFSDILRKIGDSAVNIDMISQTSTQNKMVNISFTSDLKSLEIIKNILSDKNTQYALNDNASKISIEGVGMEHRYGVAGKAIEILENNDIFIYAITTSETKISLCVDRNKLLTVTELIKKSFALD